MNAPHTRMSDLHHLLTGAPDLPGCPPREYPMALLTRLLRGRRR
jgi:hypothetical protein